MKNKAISPFYQIWIPIAIVSVTLLAMMCSLQSILLPFVVALAMSYFFAPLMVFFQNKGINRSIGATLVITLLALLIILISTALIPVIYKQIKLLIILIKNSGTYHHYMENDSLHPFNRIEELIPGFSEKIISFLNSFSSEFMSYSATIMNTVLESSIATINIISLIFITPVIIFYLLRDWEGLVKAFYKLIPKRFSKTVIKLLVEIDVVLASYIRGQTNVCLIMAVYYSIALSLFHLEYGFTLGIISGLLTIIPFIGSLVCGLLCCLITVTQFSGLSPLLIVIPIFLVGLLLEGYVVVPYFIVSQINLHPVWVIFGLLIGTNLMGFTGMILALPITSIIATIIKFSLEHYYKSNFYKA